MPKGNSISLNRNAAFNSKAVFSEDATFVARYTKATALLGLLRPRPALCCGPLAIAAGLCLSAGITLGLRRKLTL